MHLFFYHQGTYSFLVLLSITKTSFMVSVNVFRRKSDGCPLSCLTGFSLHYASIIAKLARGNTSVNLEKII